MNWLEEVMEQTKESESPRSFIKWAALSAVSATVARNLWLDRHLFVLYPNLYVLLVAKSGVKKSFPITMARKLVERVGSTRVISGRNTIESIITELATATTKEGSQSGIIKDARAFIVSGEFHVLLQENPASSSILTDLYDTGAYDVWTNSTKSSGKESLKNPCITLLGASNPTLLKEALPDYAYQGGFIGRTVMVQENARAFKNPLVDEPEIVLDYDKLAKYLQGISKLSGPFIWSPDAKDYFKNWYMHFNQETDDQTGTIERLDSQVLKVAMLISLTKSPELVLQKEDIESALADCLHHSESVSNLSSQAGASDLGRPQALVIQELATRFDFTISRVDLLKKYRGQLDKFILDKVVANLLEMEAIEEYRKEGKLNYKLTQVLIDRVNKVRQNKSGK